jgi:lysophospholipase L1-like esterase
VISRRSLSLAALAALATPARAIAEPACPIPPDLALSAISLPTARRAVTESHRLSVLTFGGDHTAGTEAGEQSATYPARLEAALKAALPNVAVTVRNAGVPGSTAADIPPMLPDLIDKFSANLVIWGPGGRDVALRLDVKEFRAAIMQGIQATRHGGADLILMDTTYVPSPTRMAMMEPYRARIRESATAAKVPLLARHELMRHWIESGTLDLDARDQAARQAVARRLYACVAESLAGPIIQALR